MAPSALLPRPQLPHDEPRVFTPTCNANTLNDMFMRTWIYGVGLPYVIERRTTLHTAPKYRLELPRLDTLSGFLLFFFLFFNSPTR